MGSASERSIQIGGSATGAALVTGDCNTVMSVQGTSSKVEDCADPIRNLGVLRDLISKLEIAERGRIDRAFTDAEEELAKPEPNKEEVAGALQRILKIAQTANAFGEQLQQLIPVLTALAAWAGPVGHNFMSMLHITSGV